MVSQEIEDMKQIMVILEETGDFAYPEDGNFAELRQRVAELSEAQPIESGVKIIEDVLDGVHVELSIPEQVRNDVVIIYYHGGAFITGSALESRGYASSLAAESGWLVYAVDYALAPENPYPEGLNDCFDVYKAVMEKYPYSKVALIGDSAGGNLSLVTSIKAKDDGIKLPSAVCVFSPVTEMAVKLPSWQLNAGKDIGVKENILDLLRKYYFQGFDPSAPYISPLRGDFTGFPRLKIIVDSSEFLLDDSRILAEKAEKAGVEVDLQVLGEMFHAVPIMGKGSPETYQMMKDTIKFIGE